MEVNKDMDEIITRLEALFEEKGYTIEEFKKHLNHVGELNIIVDRIKEEISKENPGISHEELIEQTSMRVADMVQEHEMSGHSEVEQAEK